MTRWRPTRPRSLATGTRFGETLALTGDDVQAYTDEKTGRRRVKVNINAHVVDEKGKGIRHAPGRKGNRPGILVRVPNWSEDMFLRRKATVGSGPPTSVSGKHSTDRAVSGSPAASGARPSAR